MDDGEDFRRLTFEEFVAELDTVRLESEAVLGALGCGELEPGQEPPGRARNA